LAVGQRNPSPLAASISNLQNIISEATAAIMSADTPTDAEGGGTKNIIKDEKTNNRGQRGNNNARRSDQCAKKEKFLGADPNLQGYVFEAK